MLVINVIFKIVKFEISFCTVGTHLFISESDNPTSFTLPNTFEVTQNSNLHLLPEKSSKN